MRATGRSSMPNHPKSRCARSACCGMASHSKCPRRCRVSRGIARSSTQPARVVLNTSKWT
eukprot:6026655-Lingulodinium_polyedra.AAC.1